MPLAQALQYEVLYYRLHLNRDCYQRTTNETTIDDAMAAFDAASKST